jgi:hypothetical protein
MGRAFGLLATILAIGVGLFIYSRQAQTVSGSASGASVETIAVTAGVKNDLIAIANAERAFNAGQGRYATLDELISGNYITIRTQRPPYSYDLETTSGGFRVTATRSTPGSPAQLWIDESMSVQSSN